MVFWSWFLGCLFGAVTGGAIAASSLSGRFVVEITEVFAIPAAVVAFAIHAVAIHRDKVPASVFKMIPVGSFLFAFVCWWVVTLSQIG